MSAPMSRNTFKISIFIIIVKTGQQRQERRTGIKKIFPYPNNSFLPWENVHLSKTKTASAAEAWKFLDH